MIISGVGSPGSVGPTSGGKIYAFNNINSTPQIVAPARSSRTQISFYNPGANTIWVAPTVAQAINSIPTSITDQVLIPSPSALGGCFMIYPNGGSLTLVGECQKAWQAFSSTGSTNALTVSDSNV